METQRSNHPFCSRPGCGIAKPMHGVLPNACANFIAPGSLEARVLKELGEETKSTDSSDLNSGTIDRARNDALNKAQWAAIKLAKARLSLALTAEPAMFRVHCLAALSALRGLGEE